MNLIEMFGKFESGVVSAHSELGTRDESKQTRNFEKRIKRFQWKTGTKSRMFVMKDVVIPFNPFTCEADESYNDKTPFRPILLASQTIEGIKQYCASHPDIAGKWEGILGAKLDWSAPVTIEDYYAFKHADFIKPRITTYFTVRLNFNGAHGFPEYATKYLVDPKELNENNFYDYDTAPNHHLATMLFMSMIRPEIEDMEKDAEKMGLNKETIANKKAELRSRCPVGMVTPTNIITVIYLPYGENVRDFDPQNYREFEKFMCYMNYNQDKWSVAFTDVKKDDTLDYIIDYYDFTVNIPDSSALTSSGKVLTDKDFLEMFKAMTIQVTDGRSNVIDGKVTVDGKTVSVAELYRPVFNGANAYFLRSQEQSSLPDGDHFEKVVSLSVNFRPIDSVADKIPAACNEVFLSQFADSKYFTEKVKTSNAKFFALMNPANALALAAHDEDDLNEAAKQQAESMSAFLKAAASAESNDALDGFENIGDAPIAEY